MWHDNETTVDYVNFRLVAKACAELIRDTGGDPISIGISGGWGTGKSSLVRMVASELSPKQSTSEQITGTENSEFVVITFNPWLYQGFEDARSALLQTVGDAILDTATRKTGVLDKAKSLIKRINLLRLAQLGGEVAATLFTGVPVGLIGKVVEAGADAIFAEAVHTLKEYKEFTDQMTVPVLANITEFGATPMFTTEELASVGIAMVLYPLSAFRAMNKAALAVYQELKDKGTQEGVLDTMQTRMELYDMLNYHAYEQKMDELFSKGKAK